MFVSFKCVVGARKRRSRYTMVNWFTLAEDFAVLLCVLCSRIVCAWLCLGEWDIGRPYV